ncbi:MAG: 2-amino-4-hydroxy-6-hydroxymethyldihydropteridine diphosphokinase [Candidatus Contendobacter sp.]
MPAARAYIGIGSNLDDPVQQVQRAFQALRTLPVSRLSAQSPLYRSAPVGGPPDQPDYINAVAVLDTTLLPAPLLAALQQLEQAQGRTRAVRWGPRTLDLDLLLYDALVSEAPNLTLPHPRLQERAFVLQPLYDLAPQLIIPGQGSVRELWAKISKQGLSRLDSTL